MSQYSDIMETLDDIKVQNSWLVQAVKYLLATDVDLDLENYEGDLDLEDEPDYSEFEHVAVRPGGKRKPCNHNHQTLVDGMVKCAKCGFNLVQSGVRDDSQGQTNTIVPARGHEDESLNHVSSQNDRY